MSNSFLDLSSVETPSLLEAWRWLVPESMSIQSITPFGDAFLLDPTGTVHWLNTDNGQLTQVATTLSEFKQGLANPSNIEQWFVPKLLEALHQHFPVLRSGQCYSPILPPCVGGTYKISNFEVSSLGVHFGILGQLHEKNRSLPDGAPIKQFEANE